VVGFTTGSRGEVPVKRKAVINDARGFYSIIQEFDFNLLLHVFSYVLPKPAALLKILQTKPFDVSYNLKKICDFQCELKALRDQFGDI
jgi:hypothetical protein